MKTKQRILTTCLTLFNEEGEQNVTTVDIANALDISPGNLYYHFKGKEPIILPLFEQHEDSYSTLLASTSELEITTRSSWQLLYILLEEIYAFRFFYHNAHNILERIPALQRRFSKLLRLQHSSLELVLLSMLDKGMVRMRPDDIATTANSLSMTLTHWLSHNRLEGTEDDREQLLNKGAYHMINIVGAYLAPDHQQAFNEARQLLRQTLIST